jgi:hypothetical protein
MRPSRRWGMPGKDKSEEEWLEWAEAIINYIGWGTLTGVGGGILAFWWFIGKAASFLFSRVSVIGINQKQGSTAAKQTNEKYKLLFRNSLIVLVIVIAMLGITIVYLQARLQRVGTMDVLTDVILKPGMITSTINGKRYIGYTENYKIMHICRAQDNTIDPMLDSRIDKSQAFQIVDRDIVIETPLKISDRVMKELGLDTVQCFIWLIPINVSVENVVTQQQLKDQGGVYLVEHGMQTNVFGIIKGRVKNRL